MARARPRAGVRGRTLLTPAPWC